MPFWVFSIHSHSLFNITLTMSFTKLINVTIIRLWFEEKKLEWHFVLTLFFATFVRSTPQKKSMTVRGGNPGKNFLTYWNSCRINAVEISEQNRWCQIRTTSRGLHRLTDLLTTYLNTNNRNKFTTHLPSLIKIQYV